MLFLLDETDQRRINLLEILTHQKGWITIGALALLVHASERTIHSDLIYLKNKWESPLQIDISQKNGVRLGCQNAAILHEIQIDIFKSGVAPRFLRDLFFFPLRNDEFYIDRLFISKSTFIRMIPRIDARLADMHVSIQRNEQCYCLRASDEMELRKLLSAFYLELNPLLTQLPSLTIEWSIPGARKPVNFNRLYEIVCAMLHRSQNQEAVNLVLKDASALPQMVAFYLVSLLREQQGFPVESRCPLEAEISDQDLSYLAERFPAITRKSLQPIHALLMRPFQLPDDPVEDARLVSEANAFFSRVFEALHVSCPPEIQRQLVLTMKILYHYVLIYTFPIARFLRRVNGFISSMQAAHPRLYDVFHENLAVFNRAMQVDLTPSLPDLMLHSCFLFPALGMVSPPHRVFIVSDFGIEHASFIAGFIRSAMNSAYSETVQVFPVSYASAIDPAFAANLTKEDIFITTAPVFLQLAPCSTTILFHDFPSLSNFSQLYDAIYR